LESKTYKLHDRINPKDLVLDFVNPYTKRYFLETLET